MLKIYLKKILTSRIFWLVIVINIITLIIGGWYDIVQGVEESALHLFRYSSNFGIGIIVSLILYAFPFLYIFCGEISGNVTKYQLIRYGSKGYFIVCRNKNGYLCQKKNKLSKSCYNCLNKQYEKFNDAFLF